MRHLVLTRSAYGPEWDLGANRRRLAITRAITAAMMARSTVRDLTWVILVDPRDPLRSERIAAFASGGIELEVIDWQRPAQLAPAPWDHRAVRAHRLEQIAATAYRVSWRSQAPSGRARPDDATG